VDTKLVKMTKKFLARDNEPIALNIEVGKTTRHHKTGKVFRAETNLKIGKTLLRAEALGESLNEAIDLLEEELEREIKKFKEKSTITEEDALRIGKEVSKAVSNRLRKKAE